MHMVIQISHDLHKKRIVHLAVEWNGKKGDLRGGGGFIAAGLVEGGRGLSSSLLGTPLGLDYQGGCSNARPGV